MQFSQGRSSASPRDPIEAISPPRSLGTSIDLRLCSTPVYNVTFGWVDLRTCPVDGRPISTRRAIPLARYLQSSNLSN
jgi:hypothetical protein